MERLAPASEPSELISELWTKPSSPSMTRIARSVTVATCAGVQESVSAASLRCTRPAVWGTADSGVAGAADFAPPLDELALSTCGAAAFIEPLELLGMSLP